MHTGCDGTGEFPQRRRIDRLKKHIAIYQRRAGMPRPYNVDVLEGSPELHSHIVAAFPSASAARDIGCRLVCSATYGAWVECGPVDDWRGLQNYLSKEATPQAWHGAGRSFRRLKIHERLGSVSGDRVRPSKALEQELVALGRIEPRTRTYAARTKPEPETPMAIYSNVADQFYETLKSIDPRPIEQLDLPLFAPVIDIFAAAEAKRKDLGLSQREAADHLGIRQSHWSNSIVRHHDTLSPWALNRVRDFINDRAAA